MPTAWAISSIGASCIAALVEQRARGGDELALAGVVPAG